jgi:hypothetical protein
MSTGRYFYSKTFKKRVYQVCHQTSHVLCRPIDDIEKGKKKKRGHENTFQTRKKVIDCVAIYTERERENDRRKLFVTIQRISFGVWWRAIRF